MFLVDDLFLAPIKGLLWIFRRVHAAAEEELEGRQKRVTSELSELYMQLDTGRIGEEEFDRREKALLDLLDQLKRQRARAAAPVEGAPPPGGDAGGDQPRG